MDGWMDGWMDGRKVRMIKERMEGREEGKQIEGRKERKEEGGQIDGWMDGCMHAWNDGGLKKRRKEERMHACIILIAGRHAPYSGLNFRTSHIISTKIISGIPQMLSRIFDALHQVFLF